MDERASLADLSLCPQQQPPVLLFDEPAAHLDAERQDALLTTLRRLTAGRTVIMASHDPAARDIADAVIAMERRS